MCVMFRRLRRICLAIRAEIRSASDRAPAPSPIETCIRLHRHGSRTAGPRTSTSPGCFQDYLEHLFWIVVTLARGLGHQSLASTPG